MVHPDFASEAVVERLEFVQAKRFNILALEFKNVVSAHIMSIFCTLHWFGHAGVAARLDVLRQAEAQLFGFRNSRRTIIRAVDHLEDRGLVRRVENRGRYGLVVEFTNNMVTFLGSMPIWHSSVGNAPTEVCQIGIQSPPEVCQIGIPLDIPKIRKKDRDGKRACAPEEDRLTNRSRRTREDGTAPSQVDPDTIGALLRESGLAGKLKKVGSS